jgi:anion-transporting  ArsA/GET3 family ATPase
MNNPVFIKYLKSFEKIAIESTILGLAKIPDICDRYMERIIKYYSITMKYIREKEKDPKKCVRNVKKLESSSEYIDLLENCLVHKIKHLDKIFKNYPKTGKKMIVIITKMISVISKKIEKSDKSMQTSLALADILRMKDQVKILTTENEQLTSFLKKNKKELADLKKKDVRAYIAFYIIRRPLGCFVLP